MDAPLSWPGGWPWRQTSPSQIAWATEIAEKGLCYLMSISFVIYWLSTSNVASARTSTETSYFLYYDFISWFPLDSAQIYFVNPLLHFFSSLLISFRSRSCTDASDRQTWHRVVHNRILILVCILKLTFVDMAFSFSHTLLDGCSVRSGFWDMTWSAEIWQSGPWWMWLALLEMQLIDVYTYFRG